MTNMIDYSLNSKLVTLDSNPQLSTKITRHKIKQSSEAYSKEKSRSTETVSEKDLIADPLHKDYKTIVLKMLKELKETCGES